MYWFILSLNLVFAILSYPAINWWVWMDFNHQESNTGFHYVPPGYLENRGLSVLYSVSLSRHSDSAESYVSPQTHKLILTFLYQRVNFLFLFVGIYTKNKGCLTCLAINLIIGNSGFDGLSPSKFYTHTKSKYYR